MKLVDLSVVVNQDTPNYPGDPRIQIKATATLAKNSYNDHSVMFDVHSSGTHMDAPWHMIENGKTLEQIPVEQFVGRGCYIKVNDKKFDLAKVQQADIQPGDIVLFHTGMDSVYHELSYYANDRPAMPEEIAKLLVEKKVKMVGLDMCSPDLPPFPVHRILLGAGILIVENLTNLLELSGREFTVYALPVKMQLDGAPARVVAEVKG